MRMNKVKKVYVLNLKKLLVLLILIWNWNGIQYSLNFQICSEGLYDSFRKTDKVDEE